MKRLMLLVTSLFGALALAQTPMLTVSPQSAMGSTVTIDSVTLVQDGFVVVHAYDTNGELVLTPPLGLVYLTAGTHENVAIDLDPMLLADNGYGMGAKDVLPMVHIDSNANGSYEFPDGPDTPVMVDGNMVVATLSLTLGDTMMFEDGTFEVMLSGNQEVPPVMTAATGAATVTVMGDQLSIQGDFSGLSSVTGGHVHMAAMGENGGVIFPLNITSDMNGESGIFSAGATLTEEQLHALHTGMLYLNLHTETNGGGEIRAQLVPGMMGDMSSDMPDSSDMADMMDLTAAISVSAQTAMGTTITIDVVTLEQDGFVVIHAYDPNGELVLTPPLGLVYLTAGTHENVAIDLDPMLLADNGYGMGAKDVLPMVHIDSNANGSYEFPDGPDTPVMVNDAMVVANLELTLP